MNKIGEVKRLPLFLLLLSAKKQNKVRNQIDYNNLLTFDKK